MNRTMVLGGVLFFAGFMTHSKFTTPATYRDDGAIIGTVAFMLGLFFLWNGYVANYNDDPNFALLG